jgi:hypothetical protein
MSNDEKSDLLFQKGYVIDPELGEIPLVANDDPDEIIQLKNEYIQNLIEGDSQS